MHKKVTGRMKLFTAFSVFLYILFCFFSSLLIPPSFSEVEYLGGGLKYYEELRYIQYKRIWDVVSFDVPPDVMSYKNSCNFILAKQYPKVYNSGGFFTHYEYPCGIDTVYFWLIDKRSKELTGPLLESDMEKVLKEKNLEKMMKKLKKDRL